MPIEEERTRDQDVLYVTRKDISPKTAKESK